MHPIGGQESLKKYGIYSIMSIVSLNNQACFIFNQYPNLRWLDLTYCFTTISLIFYVMRIRGFHIHDLKNVVHNNVTCTVVSELSTEIATN